MRYPISIQWHITASCQHQCAHCYLFDSRTYPGERDHPLSLEDKLRVTDQLDAFGERWGFCFPQVALIGGDPLLAPDWFDFAAALRARGKRVRFCGNPETLTDTNLEKLKRLDVGEYQLSLDGTRAVHDRQRAPGSFERTVASISRLKAAGIRCGVMATCTPINADDFWNLLNFVYTDTEASAFTFDFVSRVGNAAGMTRCFTPERVLAICKRYLDQKADRTKERPDFRFNEKPGILRVLHMARGEIAAYDDGETAFADGCLIGSNGICLLADGTLLSCRRFPEIIGKLPRDDFAGIFLGSNELKRYRRPQFWPLCGNCVGWNWCRGCPATSFGDTGNPFAPPEMCFRHLLSIDTQRTHAPIGMDTDFAGEAALIKRNLRYRYAEAIDTKSMDPELPKVQWQLSCDDEAAAAFKRDPEAWLRQMHPDWSAEKRRLFAARFNAARL